jgi:hypothetical protein
VAGRVVERKAGIHAAGRLVFEQRGAAIEARPGAVAKELPWQKMRARQVARCDFNPVKRTTSQHYTGRRFASAAGEDGTRVKGSDKRSPEFSADNTRT